MLKELTGLMSVSKNVQVQGLILVILIIFVVVFRLDPFHSGQSSLPSSLSIVLLGLVFLLLFLVVSSYLLVPNDKDSIYDLPFLLVLVRGWAPHFVGWIMIYFVLR